MKRKDTIIMNDDIRNNLSTVAVILYGVLSPFIAQYLNQVQFSALFVAVVSILIAVYSASHPNTFRCLGNDVACACETEEDLINEEYEVGADDSTE